MLNIALYRPEIPPNTGNIARLCVGIQAKLHIVGKPSFDMSEKAVRRAGLDYWEHLYCASTQIGTHLWRLFLIYQESFSHKIRKTLYSQQNYEENDYFVFGRETSGLPEEIRNQFPDSNQIHIPMRPECRSLNLSNAVAIVSYEAVRQLNQQSAKMFKIKTLHK